MKTEREIFEDWCTKDDEFCIHRYSGSDDYSDNYTQIAWQAWQASASREGYKLVPVNPTKEMYLAGTHELTQIDFRDLHDNDSIQVYKAMIGAVE